jgi:glycosyl transferase family 87
MRALATLRALSAVRRRRLAIAANAALAIAVVVVGCQATYNAPDTDFTRYWFGGRNVVEGNALYGPDAPGPGFKYLPFFALWMAPFGLLPIRVAGALWYAINVSYVAGALWMAKRVVFGERRSWWWMLVVAATFTLLLHNLKTGQVNVTCFFFEILGAYWICRSDGKRDGLAGLAIGLAATIKYTPLALVPWLVLRRRWRALGGVGLGVLVFALAVPSAAFGPARHWDLVRQWFDRGTTMLSGYEAGASYSPGISTSTFLRHVLQARTATSERYGTLYVNVADLSSDDVTWLVVLADAAIVALLVLGLVSRARRDDPLRLPLEVSAVLLTVHLISPETRKAHLITLLWTLMVAGGILRRPRTAEPAKGAWAVAAIGVAVTAGLLRQPILTPRGELFASALCNWGVVVLVLLVAAVVTLRREPSLGAVEPSNRLQRSLVGDTS